MRTLLASAGLTLLLTLASEPSASALVRFNSTMLQGSSYDLQKFQQEVDRLSAPK
jgi:hypothetical protein